MELDELKRVLQGLFTDGLVTIVGSGLSAAMGLPTMWALSEHLQREMPKRVSGTALTKWYEIAASLIAEGDLETALGDAPLQDDVITAIVNVTAELISNAEQQAIRSVASGDVDFAMRRLLNHLTFADGSAQIITSNYDRMIEYAAEMNGIDVDTGFCGSYFGRLEPKRTKDSLSSWVTTSTKSKSSVKRVLRKHIALHKPHGSLDWFLHDGVPVKCSVMLDTDRLMITPGTSKYRKGYDTPFDYHRTAANRAIDSAAGFLIIGYGFNDDQLETHLRPQLSLGKPCLILTKALTPNATEVLENNRSVLALTDYENSDERGTIYQQADAEYRYPHQRLWNLSDFVRGVLE